MPHTSTRRLKFSRYSVHLSESRENDVKPGERVERWISFLSFALGLALVVCNFRLPYTLEM